MPDAKPMTNSRIHVNRETELKALCELCAWESEVRILFVHAISGFGKTVLLEEFADQVSADELPHAHIELEAGYSPPTVLWQLTRRLGIERFPHYGEEINKLGLRKPNVVVSGMLQFGWHQSVEVAWDVTHEERFAQLQVLSEAWLTDFRLAFSSRPVILMFDQYNLERDNVTVDKTLDLWLRDVLLTSVCHFPSLRIVVAGQQSPRLSQPWKHLCKIYELQPIRDAAAWMKMVKQLDGKLNQRDIELFCISEKGHPLHIATRLAILCGEWNGGD
jgi:hypothetical protein